MDMKPWTGYVSIDIPEDEVTSLKLRILAQSLEIAELKRELAARALPPDSPRPHSLVRVER